MEINYFFTHHTYHVITNEQNANLLWRKTLEKSLLAFDKCQFDAATVYLDAAINIALIRLALCKNQEVTDNHLKEPLIVYIDLACIEYRFTQTIIKIKHIISTLKAHTKNNYKTLFAFLNTEIKRLQMADQHKTHELTSATKPKNKEVNTAKHTTFTSSKNSMIEFYQTGNMAIH